MSPSATWSIRASYSGNHLYNGAEALAGTGPYVPPVYEYPHSQECALDGGYVYRGSKLPADAGRYYFGDNCSGTFQAPGVSSFAQDSSGELYLMSVTTGNLYELQP